MKKRKTRRRRSECGDTVCFHGSFARKSDAEAKAKQRGGNVIRRRIRGSIRYVVVTGKAPF